VAVVGRDREQGLIRDLLAACPKLVVVNGSAGIGKTTLWLEAVRDAQAAGTRVLAFRPGEPERQLAFAGLSGLLGTSVLDHALPLIPAPRRRALETALKRVEGNADPGLIGLGVLSVLLVLAPVIIAIDDLQWLDTPSAAALAFALRRVDQAAIGIVATSRDESSTALSTVEAAFTEDRRETVHLGPLPTADLGQVISGRLGHRAPRHVVLRLAEAAGGNPFVAVELARSVSASTKFAAGVPYPLVADPRRLVNARIEQVSTTAAELLWVLAAAGRASSTMLARLFGAGRADTAIAELRRADLATYDDGSLHCSHPLIASYAYASVPPEKRRRLHARLAKLIDEPGARARHLALSTERPDESVAAALDLAATSALNRGATVVAADLAELAVEATPPEHVDSLVRRELALAGHLTAAGSADEARARLTGALARMAPGPGRVDVLCALSDLAMTQAEHGVARRWYEQAVAEAGDDRLAAAQAHTTAGMSAWPDLDAQLAHCTAATTALAGREEEAPSCAATALVLLACVEFQAGHDLQLQLVDRAVELEPATQLPAMKRPSVQRALLVGLVGRVDESIDAIQACLAQFRREGEWSVQPHLLRCLSQNEYIAGRLDAACEHAQEAARLGDELGLDDCMILAANAYSLAARGEIERAREYGGRALDRAQQTDSTGGVAVASGAQGVLELLDGQPAAAADALWKAHDIQLSNGIIEPGWWRLEGELIEALLGCGRFAEASDVAKAFIRQAESTDNTWSALVAGRAAGLVALAAGRLDDAVTVLETALARPGARALRLDWARTRLALGTVLRHANRRRAARDVLADVVASLTGMGALVWARRAQTELAAVSGRAPAGGTLTAMERTVSRLAAAGNSNGEIANALYLSVRTVETHLSSAYRKLNVRSRTEMAGRLLQDEDQGFAG
jgi:DNA-binding CsgD family transcriptional regulator/tetratricopeptide (TPR) repeat protein